MAIEHETHFMIMMVRIVRSDNLFTVDIHFFLLSDSSVESGHSVLCISTYVNFIE